MLDEIFKALSDPTRRKILELLHDGDLSAGEIASHFSLANSTMSAHFAALKHAGLVTQERHKTKIVYSLNISAAEEMAGMVMALFKKPKTAALPRTKKEKQ